MRTSRAIMPINANNCIASPLDYLSTDSISPSNYSSDTASTETSLTSGSSNLGNLCDDVASRATGTRILPHRPVASPGYVKNGISSDVVPVVETSSSSLPTSDYRIQKTSRRLAHTKVLKPRQPRAMGHAENRKFSDPTASAKPPHRPPKSAANPNSRYGFSKCPRQGCSAIRKGLDHRVNLRTHVRDVHEKPAPPTCEICEKVYVKNDSLKRHIKASHHAVELPEGARIVRMRRADGTVYATYTEIHDYVNVRKMEKA